MKTLTLSGRAALLPGRAHGRSDGRQASRTGGRVILLTPQTIGRMTSATERGRTRRCGRLNVGVGGDIELIAPLQRYMSVSELRFLCFDRQKKPPHEDGK